MKNLLLTAALMAGLAVSAQTTTTTTSTTTTDAGKSTTTSMTSVRDNAVTISAYGSFPVLNQAGLSVEFMGKKESHTMGGKTVNYYSSMLVNVAYGMMKYDSAYTDDDADGNGIVVELGHRTYFKETGNGFYVGNYLSYGNIKYDDNVVIASNVPVTANLKGNYSYFSFFSPEIGYKIKAGPIAIDPFVGYMWKIEIKGKGDIENRDVNNWTPRVGLKIGYQF